MKPVILGLIAMVGMSTLSGCMVVTCADGNEAKDEQGRTVRVTTRDEEDRAVAAYCLKGDPAAADLSAADPALVEKALAEGAQQDDDGGFLVPAGGAAAALLLALSGGSSGGSTNATNSTSSTN
jgi:hypothetical protein